MTKTLQTLWQPLSNELKLTFATDIDENLLDTLTIITHRLPGYSHNSYNISLYMVRGHITALKRAVLISIMALKRSGFITYWGWDFLPITPIDENLPATLATTIHGLSGYSCNLYNVLVWYDPKYTKDRVYSMMALKRARFRMNWKTYQTPWRPLPTGCPGIVVIHTVFHLRYRQRVRQYRVSWILSYQHCFEHFWH